MVTPDATRVEGCAGSQPLATPIDGAVAVDSELTAAKDAAPSARWSIREMGRGEPLGVEVTDGSRLVAGRGAGVDLLIDDPGVSRRHFQLEERSDRLELVDLGSSGGTTVNDEPVKRTDLGASDVIGAGSRRFMVLQMQPLVPVVDESSLEVVHYADDTARSRVPSDGPLVVGRSRDSDVVIDHGKVSRRHLEIRPHATGATVVDLGAANGIEVNGRPIQGMRHVAPGDRIGLAGTDRVLVVEAPFTQAEPIAFEFSAEGMGRRWAVEVDTGLESTVAEVGAALAHYVGAAAPPEGRTWTAYIPERGTLLHPRNRWVDSGVNRGDHLVIAPVADQAGEPTEALRFGASRVAINQLPRSVLPPAVHKVRPPRPPETQAMRGRGVSWQIVGGAGIIVAGLLMALFRPEYLQFALLGGLVGMASIGAGIMGEQSRRRFGVRQYRERLVALDAELASTCAGQHSRFNQVNPAPDQVAQWVWERGRRLWERRPGDADFLRLRVGTGSRPPLLDVDDAAAYSDSPYLSELDEVLDRHRRLVDAPVLSPPLDEAPVVGVVGSRREVLELASWLVMQAAVLHAPSELDIVIPAANQDWLWARWLPHVERPDGVDVSGSLHEAASLGRRLRADGAGEESSRGGEDQGRARLIVIPHRDRESVTDLLAHAPGPKTLCVVLADRASDLPSQVDVVMTVNGDSAQLDGPWDDGPIGEIRIDRMGHEAAGRLSARMGRFLDPRRPAGRASSQLGLLDLIGAGKPRQLDLGRIWSNPTDSRLSAVVGNTLDDERLVLGFRSDGVHGVVGGTTGSGKSEFLQTLLMSLALTHRPEQLSFFLIDYKGGATFAALAGLPHVSGVVTDLERTALLADRAFTSLEAEMDERKKLLDQARVPGVIEYERLPEAATQPIPALLVVIDEFALLVRQRPDVKERLDLVATQGRSLGVHLLLATQSPTNVITPAIRSNTQVWISLRVVDESESVELLGHRDAARIPPDRPGRGFVRFGGSQSITGFQTARVARPVDDGRARSAITVRPYADETPQPSMTEQPMPRPTGRTVTELDEVCAAIADQSRTLGVAAAAPLWLDPLPDRLAPPETVAGPVLDAGRLGAAIGLLDDPARHVQEGWSVDLTGSGNLLVVGTRGSGKTTTLRQLVADLAARHSPDTLHVYAVESGAGSLSPLASLPHCGAVVAAADRERLYRVFGRLIRLMESRRENLAESGSMDFLSWRRTAMAPEPWVLLVIDDYPAFKEAADGSVLGVLNDQLLSLAQGGAAVGIHVIVATSQAADFRTSLTNLFGARILHRQAEAADYALLDLRLRPGEVPAMPPGRSRVEGGYEVQVYLGDEDRFDEIARTWTAENGPAAIERLPSEVFLSDLADIPRSPDGPVIGIGGDEYGPVRLDLDRGEPHLIVAGDGRTGRSTTLLTLFEALAAAEPEAGFTVVSPRPGLLRSLVGHPRVVSVATGPDEITRAINELAAAAAGSVLLIDDAESLPTEAGGPLEKLLREGPQAGFRCFVAGRSADLARSFEPWVRYLVSLRSGILLMPGPDSGFLFDQRLPATQAPMVLGRGYLCARSKATLVQIALPTQVVGHDDPGSRR